MYLAIAFAALMAGIIQGVTGFGASIIMMMALPLFLPITQGAGCSVAITILFSIIMIFNYHQYIDFKKAIKPAILYLIVSTTTISLSTSIDPTIAKKILGVFLILISIYYLFINKDNNKKDLSLPVSIFCIVFSGVCDGMFGIGGPLMVLYFMNKTHNTHQYLGTIQCFFLIISTVTTIFRIYKGILVASHIPIILTGILCIVIGGLIANRLVNYLDERLVKKITYVMIGISGILNIK